MLPEKPEVSTFNGLGVVHIAVVNILKNKKIKK